MRATVPNLFTTPKCVVCINRGVCRLTFTGFDCRSQSDAGVALHTGEVDYCLHFGHCFFNSMIIRRFGGQTALVPSFANLGKVIPNLGLSLSLLII